MNEELIKGKLCEEGFMKETYDFEKEDLVYNVTEKGKNKIRELVQNDPEFRKVFIEKVKEEVKSVPDELKIQTFKKMCEVLK